MVKSFSSALKLCSISLLFNTIVGFGAYTPKSIKGKYNADYIDYNFYYGADSGSGKGWMPKLAYHYSGCDSGNMEAGILGVRRSMVPSSMVDGNGDLYALSVCNYANYGPIYSLRKYCYSEGSISVKIVKYYPWGVASDDKNPVVGYEPYFDEAYGHDENFFRKCFHNVFQPCIFQELETAENVMVFHHNPIVRFIGSNWSTKTDFEGGVVISFNKSSLTRTGYYRDSPDNDNLLYNGYTLVNYGLNDVKSFVNHSGNYQGFLSSTGHYWCWLFHPHSPNDSIAASDAPVSLSDEDAGIHCIRYDTSTFARKGTAEVVATGSAGLNSSVEILPRFFKIGDYVYFATIKNGLWFNLHRIMPNQGDTDSVGTLETLGQFIMDAYVETISRAHSYAPYGWDFCILEEDGSPSTGESSASTGKILCTFFLGGGGNYITNMGSGHNWTSTYVSWTYNNAAGVLASYHFSGTNVGSCASIAYAQNAIYVTDYARASEEYVGIEDTEKTDEYRLYLNSHKIVPYTSPSGKHYMIFAYCYPGKKQHLYLGYAPYFIDSGYNVRLLTKTVFKAAGNNGWGDSFSLFTNCTRIISMDLKAGHLWITFTRDTGVDTTGLPTSERVAAGHYKYFHILVEDLIQE